MVSDRGFRTIPNPYIVGNPIEDKKMFFGRLDDFEFIRKKVTANRQGGIIVLCGSRRSGKTSILFQINQGRLGDDFLPVLIDMQSVTVQSDREFLEIIAREIDAVLEGSGSLVDEGFQSRLEANPLLAFNEFTGRLNEKIAGRNLILMFDEYELFETHIERQRFSKDVLNLMAYWMENNEGVYFLFTGSDKLEKRNPEYWESFLGKALHRRISFLSHADALRLISEPVKDIVKYDKGVTGKIFELTAGQPFYTQVICQSLVDHLNESGKNTVSEEDIDDVVEEIIENPLPQMIFSWSSMTQIERIVLSIIAELSKEDSEVVTSDDMLSFIESEKIGYNVDPNKLREAAERLFHQDHLFKDQDTEGYTFRMDLWRRWTIRMHSIWQVLDEITADGAQLEEGILPVRKRLKAVIVTAFFAAAVIIAASVLYSINVRERGRVAGLAVRQDSTRLSVDTEPAGAQIFVDRTFVGLSPVRETVPAKRSALRVTLAGYREFEDSVDLEKDLPYERMIDLEEETGSIMISSFPEGAEVVLDGNRVETRTPIRFDSLSVNVLHKCRVMLPGYYVHEFNGIELTADSVTTLFHRFSRMLHPLTVISEPAGAKILIDGVERGHAPVSISRIEEGEHLLSAVLEGYYDKSSQITVPVDENQVRIDLVLLPPGDLVLEILPYAELWIDGQLVDSDAVNYRVSLRPGRHEIELRHPVFGNLKETVILVSGETLTRTFNLERK
ncbi:MAG: PEGA domain-containing protein [Candidatus Krumholzibacteriota bacterium]|nr:PEGA domain-containing protein [Candidatus Krumholzibacteriota bacterium]